METKYIYRRTIEQIAVLLKNSRIDLNNTLVIFCNVLRRFFDRSYSQSGIINTFIDDSVEIFCMTITLSIK